MTNLAKSSSQGLYSLDGGSELKDLPQLVEYLTGLPTRIGHPNEHLASNTPTELSSPIYATAIGLLLDGIEREHSEGQRIDFSQLSETPTQEPTATIEPEEEAPAVAEPVVLPVAEQEPEKEKEKEEEHKPEKKNIIRTLSDKFTDFFKTME